ncbi:recombinase family protein [Staphylococcus pasteuri]|uniref:recombinase family protein n=1 Tax=Staphylococcus pasteuri TaxID=45972 RepID=UPI0003C08695|nr:recombinase family protein [Staphylococcus pasteuri]AGZ24993.1 putative integrase [Staphylococcus pasteuri SP1]
MKVAIYTRVSSQEQAIHGYSIHEQRKKLISYCEINDWIEYEVFTDAGISGGSLKRPALQKLLDSLDEFDLVLVYKLDRLTRNVRDLLEMLETFESKKVSFKSATEVFDTTTAIGKLFITIVGAMAEWERETIRERSLFGSRAAIESGKYIREEPFFYDNVDGKLVPNEHVKYINYIVDKFKEGLSANEIARLLNGKKKPPKIKNWNRQTIIRLMKNPVLRGHTKYGDMFVKNTHEPVLNEDDYYKIIDKIENRTYKSKTKHHAIFRGVLICPQCHNKLHLYAGTIKPKKGKAYTVRRYTCDKCHRDKAVHNVSFNESEIERKFVDVLNTMDLSIFTVRKPQIQKNVLENDEQKIKDQRKKLTHAYSMGYIEEEEFKDLMDETKQLLQDIHSESKPEEKEDVSINQIKAMNNFIMDSWKTLTIEEKEKLIIRTVKEIEIEFIPRELNNEGNINTVTINKIHFVF